jgi:hypothetical protein
MSTINLLTRTVKAIWRHYKMKKSDPQCPRKLAEWVNKARPVDTCSLSVCKSEAQVKFSKQCPCGRYKTTV